MEHPFEKIINFLKQHTISFELMEHEPVYTSEQAAAIRGISLHGGMKSLLLKADNNFFLIIIPGDKRLDSKKVKALLNVKKLRFATPEEVVEIMGCEIGACYPFGNLLNIPMYVDTSFLDIDVVSFNPGRHDRSIKMKWEDYEKVIKPQMVEVIVK